MPMYKNECDGDGGQAEERPFWEATFFDIHFFAVANVVFYNVSSRLGYHAAVLCLNILLFLIVIITRGD